jgi:hypothetical protein
MYFIKPRRKLPTSEQFYRVEAFIFAPSVFFFVVWDNSIEWEVV